VLAVPVAVLSMIPALQFTYWQWLTLTLAAPVVVWGAWPFHRAAAINARHGAATMDTLISVGVLAAFGWSLYALFFGGAGMPGMRMSVTFVGTPQAGGHEVYLEVAALVTVFILLGRYLEVRAKRQSGEALRALLVNKPRRRDVARDLRCRPGTDVPLGNELRLQPLVHPGKEEVEQRSQERCSTDEHEASRSLCAAEDGTRDAARRVDRRHHPHLDAGVVRGVIE